MRGTRHEGGHSGIGHEGGHSGIGHEGGHSGIGHEGGHSGIGHEGGHSGISREGDGGAAPRPGDLLTLEVAAPAAGGVCVARHGGRVVFVRHALPGELVRARVTEVAARYLRADAEEIRRPAAGRVPPPCPHAGPGRCGGCDWQHADAATQRALKSAVVREQFARLAGLALPDAFSVQALPGGLLGWRTRIGYARRGDGTPALHRARSADLEPVERCLLGVAQIADAPVTAARDAPAAVTGIELVTAELDGARAVESAGMSVLQHQPGRGGHSRGRRAPDAIEVVGGPSTVHRRVAGRRLQVAATGFWQIHRAAAELFAEALLAAVGARSGERVLDLYAGAGLFSVALAEAVGPTGRLLAIESDAQAVRDATANLAGFGWARAERVRIDATLAARVARAADVVVLDPPRAGAGTEVLAALCGGPARVIGYLSCDPATLARDVAAAIRQGWRLDSLRGFDAFPMTQHVECLAVLVPGRSAIGAAS